MTDPQVWTLIGVFAAAMLGGLTLVVTMLSRVIRAEVGGIRAEIGGMRAEMTGQFAVLGVRIDNLDRDVQVITERIWRGDRDG